MQYRTVYRQSIYKSTKFNSLEFVLHNLGCGGSLAEVPGSNPASPTMILIRCRIIVYNNVEKLRVERETYPCGKKRSLKKTWEESAQNIKKNFLYHNKLLSESQNETIVRNRLKENRLHLLQYVGIRLHLESEYCGWYCRLFFTLCAGWYSMRSTGNIYLVLKYREYYIYIYSNIWSNTVVSWWLSKFSFSRFCCFCCYLLT